MVRSLSICSALVAAVSIPLARLDAQIPARDPSGVLEQVLPPEVAQQVLDRIAEARARGLPAAALEHRALELHAKGLPPAEIPEAVSRVEDAMAKGKSSLQAGGRSVASDDEVEAAGNATANGVDGATISALAKSAPSGRTLAVPITVLTSLVERGVAQRAALSEVLTRLQARASDEELASLPEQPGQGQSHKPESPGATLPGSSAAGGVRPAWVPANGGQATRPASVPVSGPARGGHPN
jgi:hypothetical protein